MKKNQTSILTSTNIIVSAVNKAISKAQTGITTAASPLKTSNTATKQSASVRPTTVPAAYSAGRNVVDAQSVSKTLNDARLLNEQKQREVQAVQQLPKDFPMENWEKMPVKAQLFTIQRTGLSKEDQWTLLNATTPFHELANASPILTSEAKNTGGYEKQPVFKSSASVRPNLTSGASNTGSSESRSAFLQALDRFESLSGVSNTGSSKGQQPRFTGQDADTQRAEQRASRKVTDAYYKQNQDLTDNGIDASSLSGTGKDIYESTQIAMANEIVQGTLDSSKQNKMIGDASAGIAPGKTAPTSVQDWKERVSQADTASKEMFDMLESVHVDTDHLTTQQSYIIEIAERQLRDGIINGALDENGVDEMIRSICKKVTSETTPPKGGAYVTLMDTGYKQQPVRQMMPALGTLGSSGFDADALAAVKENSDDPYQRAVYNQAIADYNLAIKNGYVAIGNFNIFYNAAMKKAYEYSARKFNFEYTNEKGEKATGTVAMKDLVDPEDDSTGARLARFALNLYGLGYEEKAVLNPGDPKFKQVDKVIDCSGLVNYSAFQISPDLAKEIGNGARNQIVNTKAGEVWRKTTEDTLPEIEDLETGDLLYWADENNKIVHTAIYLRDGLMVESGNGGVKIAEIRYTTIDNDGSKHNLVQINRLD